MRLAHSGVSGAAHPRGSGAARSDPSCVGAGGARRHPPRPVTSSALRAPRMCAAVLRHIEEQHPPVVRHGCLRQPGQSGCALRTAPSQRADASLIATRHRRLGNAASAGPRDVARVNATLEFLSEQAWVTRADWTLGIEALGRTGGLTPGRSFAWPTRCSTRWGRRRSLIVLAASFGQPARRSTSAPWNRATTSLPRRHRSRGSPGRAHEPGDRHLVVHQPAHGPVPLAESLREAQHQLGNRQDGASSTERTQ